MSLPHETLSPPDVMDMLADIARLLGPQGSFADLTRERSEEILLLLLRSGRIVPAHQRIWHIAIPDSLLYHVHAAGGRTYAEWAASPEGQESLAETARAKAAAEERDLQRHHERDRQFPRSSKGGRHAR